MGQHYCHSVCPHCGREQPPLAPGDAGLCLACLEWHVAGAGDLRRPTATEKAMIAASRPCRIAWLLAAATAAKHAHNAVTLAVLAL
jgi:hypothetical protein